MPEFVRLSNEFRVFYQKRGDLNEETTYYYSDYHADDLNDITIADEGLDEIDVAIAAFLVLHSDTPKENYWTEKDLVEIIKPLYNGSGEVIAWYLKLSNGAHAVVNNNKQNPMVIEFGEADNLLIADKIQKNTEAEQLPRHAADRLYIPDRHTFDYPKVMNPPTHRSQNNFSTGCQS